MNLLDCESLATAMGLIGSKVRNSPWWITSYWRNDSCPGLIFSRSFWVVALIMPLDSMATWQMVQEHCSLPDIFKFQVRISGSLPWKVGCWTLGPFPLGCASFYIIAKLTTRHPPGRVGQGFCESLWNWKPLLPLIISAPQKWIVKWFHKFVQRDEQWTFERVFSLWLQTEFLFLSSVSTTPAILACAV